MQRSLAYLAALGLAVSLTACDRSGDHGHAHGPDSHTHSTSEQSGTAPSGGTGGGHTHADGSWHAGPHEATPSAGTHIHADGSVHAASEASDDHAVVKIGTVTIGNMDIELAQGHGAIVAGKESHLVVRLPYADNGTTAVRAWIGTEDRTLSFVGRGDFNATSNVYDIHAIAPNPLPADAKWWIEVEKSDGTRVVGSAKPITE
jgi:hypothetical protein